MRLENHHGSSISNAYWSYLVFETCLLFQYKLQRNLHVQFQHSGSTWVLVWVSQKQNLRWGLLQERFIEEVFSGEIGKGGEVMAAEGKKPSRVSAQVKFQPQSEPVGALHDKYCCRGRSTRRHGSWNFLLLNRSTTSSRMPLRNVNYQALFALGLSGQRVPNGPRVVLKKVDSLSC